MQVGADQSDLGKLWRSVDVLLGRGRVPASSSIDAETLNRFFADKVEKVRSNTSGASPPTFSRVRSGVSLVAFSPLTIDDVITAVHRLPDKSSAADPIPTNVLKQVIDLVAPFITELINRSLKAKQFPDVSATHSSRRLSRRPASMLPTPVRIARFRTSAFCRNSWSV